MDDNWSVDFIEDEDANKFHLPNEIGEDFRRVFARSPNESSPLTMRIKLVEVHHGKMVYEREACQASLLVFELRFQSKLQKRRYQSVAVTLEFFDKGGNDRRNPVVVHIAPDRMHWLNKTTYDRNTKYGASVDFKAGIPVASGGPNVHWDVDTTQPLHFKATLTGEPHSGKGQSMENAVTWSMQENEDEATGVPSFLQTSVLLKRSHNLPFYAMLRVKSAVDMVSTSRRSFSITTDRDKRIDPVTFTPGKVQVNNASATGINKEDLKHMEKLPINSYFKVNLSEEDGLTPAPPETTQTTKKDTEKASGIASDHSANPGEPEGFPVSPAPAVKHTANSDAKKEPSSPIAPVQATDKTGQTDSPSAATEEIIATEKTKDGGLLVPEIPPTAIQVALQAVSKAAEATRVASKAAQESAEAVQKAFEAVSRAAEAVERAAEEKQI